MSKDMAKSRARLKVVTEKGDLYAASSADRRWIKIGFSTCLANRLKGLNADFFDHAPFTLIGSTVSTYRIEIMLHRALQPFHQIRIGSRKELYPAVPAIEALVRAIVALPSLDDFPLDDRMELRRWCRDEARRDPNRQPALEAHAPRIAAKREAELRYWALRAARRAAA